MPSGLRRKASTLASCGGVALIAVTVMVIWGQTRWAQGHAMEEPPHPASLDRAIVAAAKRHGVPESLVRRVIMRESKYNPLARNRKFWGLMQISYPTAKSMGFKGTPQELLNPIVNLRYAVPYLANAFVIAGKQEDAAVRLYAAGYYYTARARGLLSALRTAESMPLSAVSEQPRPILAANAVAQPPQSVGIFGALFGPGSQLQPQQTQPAAQPVVTASLDAEGAGAKPTQTAANAQADTFNGPTTDMVADKDGHLAPPKKWTRDGGMTRMARGEQPLEQIASRDKNAEPVPKKQRGRARKTTVFAALDLPASSTQAYAAPSPQDPRFAAVPSQAAIAQATAAPAAPDGAPVATSRPDGASAPRTAATVVAADESDDEVKPSKRRQTERKKKAKEAKDAKADKSASKKSKSAAKSTSEKPAPAKSAAAEASTKTQ